MSEAEKFEHRVIGKVIRDSKDKSVCVKIDRLIKHPSYLKYVKRSTKVLAHDEFNRCKANDVVELAACRPVSKRKYWEVRRIHNQQIS
jgi:small subunit ribosomal protein S17